VDSGWWKAIYNKVKGGHCPPYTLNKQQTTNNKQQTTNNK